MDGFGSRDDGVDGRFTESNWIIIKNYSEKITYYQSFEADNSWANRITPPDLRPVTDKPRGARPRSVATKSKK
uniref:Uncharacterized protein n=1 Tax=Romanomermis culicivorax TaxID=13658 RepID=A0A915J2V5_ROMCU